MATMTDVWCDPALAKILALSAKSPRGLWKRPFRRFPVILVLCVCIVCARTACEARCALGAAARAYLQDRYEKAGQAQF